MPPHVKVMKKQPKGLKQAGIAPDEVGKMFEELIGVSRVDLRYAYPRFEKLVSALGSFIRIGAAMTLERFLGNTEVYNSFVDFQNNAVKLMKLAAEIPAIPDTDRMLNNFKDAHIIAFTKVYNKFREDSVLKHIMISASYLQPYATQLAAKKTDFIFKGEGFYFKPLVFCPEMNIYDLRTSNVSQLIVNNWVSYLNQVYEFGTLLSVELQQPDIDIKKFCETVIAILTSAEREPGLQGCRQAFDKIKESMHLLESNFDKYYKEFVNSEKNTTTIFISFIRDVTEKNANSQMSIIAQFTKILNYYIEQMDKNGMKLDPAIAGVAKQARESLQTLLKSTEKQASDKRDADKRDTGK